MFFPTAGIECNPLLPFCAALAVSFFTSMGGVSGAFLLLPFQMSVLGYTNPSVSATNQFFNVLACPGGILRYWREGRLIWALAAVVALGTLPGVFAGALIRIFLLPDPRHFKVFAALVLLYLGLRMLRDIWRSRQKDKQGTTASKAGTPSANALCRVMAWNSRYLLFDFDGQEYRVSCRGLALLSLVVGLVGGAYGIGGGAIMAPFLVSMLGLPVHAVAGATLCATFLTSVGGVAFYSLLAPFWPELSVAPDWGLGLLLGLGGLWGMYLGARCQRLVPARYIKYMLVAILLFTACRYLGQAL